jgi:PAS domain-containing protein
MGPPPRGNASNPAIAYAPAELISSARLRKTCAGSNEYDGFTPLNDSLGGATSADDLRQHLLEISRERDSAYRALQEREAELARVQRIGRVGGVEVDLRDGFRNRRSPEYLLIHGLPPEAANESHQDWVNRIHPDDREETERQFLASIDGIDGDYTAEYRIIRPNDGELRWIRVIAKIERDPSGRATRLLDAHMR